MQRAIIKGFVKKGKKIGFLATDVFFDVWL